MYKTINITNEVYINVMDNLLVTYRFVVSIHNETKLKIFRFHRDQDKLRGVVKLLLQMNQSN